MIMRNKITILAVFSFLMFFEIVNAVDIVISGNWKICTGASSNGVVIKAAKDLQSFFSVNHGLELEIIDSFSGSGIFLSVNEKFEGDGFSIKASSNGHSILIEAPAPRALYQGIMLLEDRLAEKLILPDTFTKIVKYPFKDRYLVWDVNLTGQNKMANGFNLENHIREAVRLGYSGVECNRFVGIELLQQHNPEDSYPWYTYWGPSMDQFVSSPLFDGIYPKEYLDRNLADLKHVVQVVESFGLKPIFMGYEPRYVPEKFFEKHPELRGPRVDHPLRSITKRYSLCTDHPEVLEHYRTLARRLTAEVPGLEEMHIIFHDSGAGFCWFNALYSGKNGPEYCKDIPMDERMRNFFGAILQGFKDNGRNIPIVAQPHGSNLSDADAFFAGTPKDVSMTAGNWASWTLSSHDPLGIDLHLLDRSKKEGRRTLYFQQHFTGFDVAPTAEYPLPYYLAARLKRARQLNIDVLTTLGGIVSTPVKKQSGMQEVYRQFILAPDTPEQELVSIVAAKLGGTKGGAMLEAIWKEIDTSTRENNGNLGFGMGTEYASRRTLVRPLVPDAPALLPDERDYWLRYTFSGYQRFGAAHLFRGEGGTPSPDWYAKNIEQASRSRDAYQKSCTMLLDFIKLNPEDAIAYPYLVDHEHQLRFLWYLYATGANLYEGQSILDKYSKKNIEEELKSDVEADIKRFELIVKNELNNTRDLIRFLNEGGDLGMVLLPEETTWAYSDYLSVLLEKKIEIMQRHLPEIKEVLNRWFNSEY
jgi:hypothetical protein